MDPISRSTVVGLAWAIGCALAGALAVTSAAAQQKAVAPAASAASAAKKTVTKSPPAKKAHAPPAAAPDWNAQLASCKTEAGMNLVKREKCVYAHCKGHWGQGECPPGQDMPTKDSFKNPFKRGS